MKYKLKIAFFLHTPFPSYEAWSSSGCAFEAAAFGRLPPAIRNPHQDKTS